MPTIYHAVDNLLQRRGRQSYSPTGFILGTTKPSSTTVGIPNGTILNNQTGDITITTPNTVLENLNIYGFIKVRAANVTIRRCRVRGSGPGTMNTAMIDCNHPNASNVLVEDCLLVPDYPSFWLNGMIGHDYTVRRTETHSVVDGFGIYNSYAPSSPANVSIEGCFVHHLAYFSPDPNHGDNRTHNDCIQIQGNSNISIIGSTLLANVSTTAGTGNSSNVPAQNPYYPSVTGQSIGVTPNVSQVSGLTIDQNWIDYGAQSITVIPGSFGATTVGSITNNRFGRNQPNLTKQSVQARRAILIDPSLTITGFPTSTGLDTTNGNVYEDDQTAVTIWRIGA